MSELGATPWERFETAESLAAEKRIDLASAYSVLLGLMSVEEGCSTELPPGCPGPDRQLAPRVDRVVAASTLRQNHGLPMSVAFRVADGELTLDEARRGTRDRNPAPAPHARSSAARSKRSPLRIMVAIGALLGASTAVAMLTWSRTPRHDPHYLFARDLVADYEFGKTQHARNYGHPVYAQALEELERIDPESISVVPGQTLAAEIRRRVQEFQTAQQAQQEGFDRKREQRQDRHAALLSARFRERVQPDDDYAKCEEMMGPTRHRPSRSPHTAQRRP